MHADSEVPVREVVGDVEGTVRYSGQISEDCRSEKFAEGHQTIEGH